MCLIVNNKLHPACKPLTADENIVVWKILTISHEGRYLTPYYFKEVRFRNGECKLKKSPLGLKAEYFIDDWCSSPKLIYKVEEGYHAYASRPIAQSYAKDSPDGSTWKLFKAYVPKGAAYYVGVAGDIVSDKLVIINEICA